MDEGEGRIELTVSGASEREAVAAGLDAILAAAHPGDLGTEADAGATVAAIRGQGIDLGAVFFELANDLLAQLDANGGGLRSVRLDGLLRTADGYTAWGYAFGEPVAGGSQSDLTLGGMPVVERDGESVTVRISLRRG